MNETNINIRLVFHKILSSFESYMNVWYYYNFVLDTWVAHSISEGLDISRQEHMESFICFLQLNEHFPVVCPGFIYVTVLIIYQYSTFEQQFVSWSGEIFTNVNTWLFVKKDFSCTYYRIVNLCCHEFDKKVAGSRINFCQLDGKCQYLLA